MAFSSNVVAAGGNGNPSTINEIHPAWGIYGNQQTWAQMHLR